MATHRNRNIITAIDELNDLVDRIGFISSACIQSSDWIDPHAANQLCATVNNIRVDLIETIKKIDACVREDPT